MTSRWKTSAIVLASALAACSEAPSPGSAQSVETGDTITAPGPISVLAASCSGCHRAPGSGDAIPSIEGWDAAALQASLTSYKADPDGTGVMHRIARGYSVDEIADIADYLGAAE